MSVDVPKNTCLVSMTESKISTESKKQVQMSFNRQNFEFRSTIPVIETHASASKASTRLFSEQSNPLTSKPLARKVAIDDQNLPLCDTRAGMKRPTTTARTTRAQQNNDSNVISNQQNHTSIHTSSWRVGQKLARQLLDRTSNHEKDSTKLASPKVSTEVHVKPVIGNTSLHFPIQPEESSTPLNTVVTDRQRTTPRPKVNSHHGVLLPFTDRHGVGVKRRASSPGRDHRSTSQNYRRHEDRLDLQALVITQQRRWRQQRLAKLVAQRANQDRIRTNLQANALQAAASVATPRRSYRPVAAASPVETVDHWVEQRPSTGDAFTQRSRKLDQLLCSDGLSARSSYPPYPIPFSSSSPLSTNHNRSTRPTTVYRSPRQDLPTTQALTDTAGYYYQSQPDRFNRRLDQSSPPYVSSYTTEPVPINRLASIHHSHRPVPSSARDRHSSSPPHRPNHISHIQQQANPPIANHHSAHPVAGIDKLVDHLLEQDPCYDQRQQPLTRCQQHRLEAVGASEPDLSDENDDADACWVDDMVSDDERPIASINVAAAGDNSVNPMSSTRLASKSGQRSVRHSDPLAFINAYKRKQAANRMQSHASVGGPPKCSIVDENVESQHSFFTLAGRQQASRVSTPNPPTNKSNSPAIHSECEAASSNCPSPPIPNRRDQAVPDTNRRLPPSALGLQLAMEMNRFESLASSIHHVDDLESLRGFARAQVEAAHLATIVKARDESCGVEENRGRTGTAAKEAAIQVTQPVRFDQVLKAAKEFSAVESGHSVNSLQPVIDHYHSPLVVTDVGQHPSTHLPTALRKTQTDLQPACLQCDHPTCSSLKSGSSIRPSSSIVHLRSNSDPSNRRATSCYIPIASDSCVASSLDGKMTPRHDPVDTTVPSSPHASLSTGYDVADIGEAYDDDACSTIAPSASSSHSQPTFKPNQTMSCQSLMNEPSADTSGQLNLRAQSLRDRRARAEQLLALSNKLELQEHEVAQLELEALAALRRKRLELASSSVVAKPHQQHNASTQLTSSLFFDSPSNNKTASYDVSNSTPKQSQHKSTATTIASRSPPTPSSSYVPNNLSSTTTTTTANLLVASPPSGRSQSVSTNSRLLSSVSIKGADSTNSNVPCSNGTASPSASRLRSGSPSKTGRRLPSSSDQHHRQLDQSEHDSRLLLTPTHQTDQRQDLEVRILALEANLRDQQSILTRINKQYQFVNQDRLTQLTSTLNHHKQLCIDIIAQIKSDIADCRTSLRRTASSSFVAADPTIASSDNDEATNQPECSLDQLSDHCPPTGGSLLESITNASSLPLEAVGDDECESHSALWPVTPSDLVSIASGSTIKEAPSQLAMELTGQAGESLNAIVPIGDQSLTMCHLSTMPCDASAAIGSTTTVKETPCYQSVTIQEVKLGNDELFAGDQSPVACQQSTLVVVNEGPAPTSSPLPPLAKSKGRSGSPASSSYPSDVIAQLTSQVFLAEFNAAFDSMRAISSSSQTSPKSTSGESSSPIGPGGVRLETAVPFKRRLQPDADLRFLHQDPNQDFIEEDEEDTSSASLNTEDDAQSALTSDDLQGLVCLSRRPSRVNELIQLAVEHLWSAFGEGQLSIACTKPPAELTCQAFEDADLEVASQHEDARFISRSFLFDLTCHYVCEIFSAEDQNSGAGNAHRLTDKNPNRVTSAQFRLWQGNARPTTFERILEIVRPKVLADLQPASSSNDASAAALLPSSGNNKQLSTLVQWTLGKKSAIDRLLELETRAEESSWISYVPEEARIKQTLANELWSKSIDDAIASMISVWRRDTKDDSSTDFKPLGSPTPLLVS